MSRRIVTWEEQDAYTSWRRVMAWRPGTLKGIKRRTHQRERREAAATIDEAMGAFFVPARQPLEDLSDCRHGCNGDCENTGGTCRCDFTCHDNRCRNCTAKTEMWLGGGWFCCVRVPR